MFVEVLQEYGLFLIETITIVVAISFVVGGIFSMVSKGRSERLRGHIEIRNINRHFMEISRALMKEVCIREEYKEHEKKEKEKRKEEKKQAKHAKESPKKRIFVLNFNGDIRASQTDSLREEITAVLILARPEKDEVFVRLESPGGLVNSYGLAASQLSRIKREKVRLVVAVDKVAASGGYLMASVADEIISAPFAILGSVGVVAQIPNFNRLLKKNNINFEQLTAGE